MRLSIASWSSRQWQEEDELCLRGTVFQIDDDAAAGMSLGAYGRHDEYDNMRTGADAQRAIQSGRRCKARQNCEPNSFPNNRSRLQPRASRGLASVEGQNVMRHFMSPRYRTPGDRRVTGADCGTAGAAVARGPVAHAASTASARS